MKKKKNAALTVPNTRALIRYRLVFQWHIIFLAKVLPDSTEGDKNTCCNTPNANMADHSVVGWNELHEATWKRG